MSRVRGWAVAAGFLWFVAFVLVALPVHSSDGDKCGNPVAALFRGLDNCVDRAAGRVGVLAVWLVLTGIVTPVFLARCALAGRDRDA